MSSKSKKYVCPFCHNIPLKKTGFLQSIKKAKVDAGVSDGMNNYSGGVEVELDKTLKEEYYKCQACGYEYVDISDYDINLVLNGMRIKPSIFSTFEYYYDSLIDIISLFRNHRTGIVKARKSIKTLISDAVQKKRIMIPVHFNNIRTFAVLEREYLKPKKIPVYVVINFGAPI